MRLRPGEAREKNGNDQGDAPHHDVELSLARVSEDLHGLTDLIARAERLVALTGAGCSTASGIPDYRDGDGEWKRDPPMGYQTFLGSEKARRRYWARSMVGWGLVEKARPNAAHRALAHLEEHGALRYLITQNVDRLHQKAGSRNVNDLHGRIDFVRCVDCGEASPRVEFQERLFEANPTFRAHAAVYAPDGDADVEDDALDLERFRTLNCAHCGGVLKPDVVFFGETVPRGRVAEAMSRVDEADALLVVGSSLMVWSGYRFVRRAAQNQIPVAIVNLGKTRADDEINVKVQADCGETLTAVVKTLSPGRLNPRHVSS